MRDRLFLSVFLAAMFFLFLGVALGDHAPRMLRLVLGFGAFALMLLGVIRQWNLKEPAEGAP